MLYPTGNIPAGYNLETAFEFTGGIISMKWAVPGGAPVYAHTRKPNTYTDEFWENLAGLLVQHVRGRPGKTVTLLPSFSFSDRPPTGVNNVWLPAQQGPVLQTVERDGTYDCDLAPA